MQLEMPAQNLMQFLFFPLMKLVLTMKTGTWNVEIQFVQKLQSLKNLKQQIYTFQKTKIFPRMKNLLYMAVCMMPCLLAK